jgi:hypothetical protein
MEIKGSPSNTKPCEIFWFCPIEKNADSKKETIIRKFFMSL